MQICFFLRAVPFGDKRKLPLFTGFHVDSIARSRPKKVPRASHVNPARYRDGRAFLMSFL